MSTSTIAIARERQLEWLLDEVLGARRPNTASQTPTARRANHWLAAAVAVLAIGIAIAVALTHESTEPRSFAIPQEPAESIPWHECHGAGQLDAVPADVTNLKCFSFDDAAIAKLARFTQLQRLDLSGNDPDQRGVTRQLAITDACLADVAKLSNLRWLSLSGCGQVTGSTLAQLSAVPQLEHLNLSSTKVTSQAIATLPELPSLRELSLSFCSEFFGRSLADVARIPGLRSLNLSYCFTVGAADFMHLSKLHELRHLDLSLCVGAFMGQSAAIFDDVTNGEPPEQPKPDGIGVNDAVVAALSGLPLESLNLNDCHNVSNAIGPSIAKMKKLQSLQIRNLHKTDAGLLERLPTHLRALSINTNHHYTQAGLRRLTRFPHLTELGLSGLRHLDDRTLAAAVQGKPLRKLRIGGALDTRRMGPQTNILQPKLTAACAEVLAGLTELEELELPFCEWLSADVMKTFATLPRLRHISFHGAKITTLACAALAASESLRSISFSRCPSMQIESLRALQGTSLTKLDLYSTQLEADAVNEVIQQWPRCVVRMPNGRWLRVP